MPTNGKKGLFGDLVMDERCPRALVERDRLGAARGAGHDRVAGEFFPGLKLVGGRRAG